MSSRIPRRKTAPSRPNRFMMAVCSFVVVCAFAFRGFILGLPATSLTLGFVAIPVLEPPEHPVYLGVRDTLAARRARQNIIDDFPGPALGRKPVHRGRRQIRNRCGFVRGERGRRDIILGGPQAGSAFRLHPLDELAVSKR
jgi:hypothetical protein